MGMIPLGDASRRPSRFPVATASIILLNGVVFLLELSGGDAFVTKWSVIPADIVAGNHWITILTSMFMHGSWSHILGNMVFLWAFGPEVEDPDMSGARTRPTSRNRPPRRERVAPFHARNRTVAWR